MKKKTFFKQTKHNISLLDTHLKDLNDNFFVGGADVDSFKHLTVLPPTKLSHQLVVVLIPVCFSSLEYVLLDFFFLIITD